MHPHSHEAEDLHVETDTQQSRVVNISGGEETTRKASSDGGGGQIPEVGGVLSPLLPVTTCVQLAVC